ncbi:hypothetical protein VNO77_27711 [Canavalia gladiata]|uniref:Uncharacterized protein n=1 Tax=Canavalia gladiata TaxID=3824 RepID=A0AAN9Q4D1_CANGL
MGAYVVTCFSLKAMRLVFKSVSHQPISLMPIIVLHQFSGLANCQQPLIAEKKYDQWIALMFQEFSSHSSSSKADHCETAGQGLIQQLLSIAMFEVWPDTKLQYLHQQVKPFNIVVGMTAFPLFDWLKTLLTNLHGVLDYGRKAIYRRVPWTNE